jgi:hypothetical protein
MCPHAHTHTHTHTFCTMYVTPGASVCIRGCDDVTCDVCDTRGKCLHTWGRSCRRQRPKTAAPTWIPSTIPCPAGPTYMPMIEHVPQLLTSLSRHRERERERERERNVDQHAERTPKRCFLFERGAILQRTHSVENSFCSMRETFYREQNAQLLFRHALDPPLSCFHPWKPSALWSCLPNKFFLSLSRSPPPSLPPSLSLHTHTHTHTHTHAFIMYKDVCLYTHLPCQPTAASAPLVALLVLALLALAVDNTSTACTPIPAASCR